MGGNKKTDAVFASIFCLRLKGAVADHGGTELTSIEHNFLEHFIFT